MILIGLQNLDTRLSQLYRVMAKAFLEPVTFTKDIEPDMYIAHAQAYH